MVEIEDELVQRAIQWCAQAGRDATAAEILSALGNLGWDERLAARALLADPPPARPLGPFALADMARGAPADVAAERERGGRYVAALEAAARPLGGSRTEGSTPKRAGRPRKGGRAPFVVKRAADRVAPRPQAPATLPLFDELLREEGRAVVSRLVRRHGGRRTPIVAALTAGWRRADGAPVTSDDFERLLAHHGMARAFATRERDEILHALRVAGGVRAKACADLSLPPSALDEALTRLGATAEAERLRDAKRRELRALGTLTQRTHLLLDQTDRLGDLDLLEEFIQDLKARLPDHLRALSRPGSAPLDDLLCRSLALDARGVERLVQLTGLRLEAGAQGSRPPARPRRPAGPGETGPHKPTGPGRTASGPRGPSRERSPGGPPRGSSRGAPARGAPGGKGSGAPRGAPGAAPRGPPRGPPAGAAPRGTPRSGRRPPPRGR